MATNLQSKPTPKITTLVVAQSLIVDCTPQRVPNSTPMSYLNICNPTKIIENIESVKKTDTIQKLKMHSSQLRDCEEFKQIALNLGGEMKIDARGMYCKHGREAQFCCTCRYGNTGLKYFKDRWDLVDEIKDKSIAKRREGYQLMEREVG